MKALCTFLIFLLIVQYTSETCNSPLLNESITICHDREAGKDEYRCCGIEFIYKNDNIEKNYLELIEDYNGKDKKKEKGKNKISFSPAIQE